MKYVKEEAGIKVDHFKIMKQPILHRCRLTTTLYTPGMTPGGHAWHSPALPGTHEKFNFLLK
jgi:hypothetical protein